ncbi:hypothetical protein [Roseicyclus mahoneyensis]|uniref:Uncharacterized protein n=1 Tax=Roseicyclus mahoneyensis TaxID=164332 RepID=A0A316GF16_9RHOB|nr:hypothetical protein [Roseicyclus mahoneyensis]PWK59603.1 hypothetical protein C7455_107148 [Roseicyclus mahoneyensis]
MSGYESAIAAGVPDVTDAGTGSIQRQSPDQIGLARERLGRLHGHLASTGAAVIMIALDAKAILRLRPSLMVQMIHPVPDKPWCDL